MKEKESLASVLKKFDGIWVETNTMKLALDKCGFSNVAVVPNFKELKALNEQELEYPSGIPLRLCTFSRVMKEKGIGTIVDAIKNVNEPVGYTIFSLDIYGQIQAGEEEWFEDLKSSFPEYIQYKGCVDSKSSIDTIKDYLALVFPTHFYTEGIPGTVIDAYCAGVPVISAKWESYADVIDEGITGFGYEFDNEDELKQLLLSIAEEPQKVLKLRRNCLEKAKQFAPERIVADIENYLVGGIASTR